MVCRAIAVARTRWVFPLLALALSGCADVCQHAETVAKSFAARSNSYTRVGTLSSFDVTACQASLEQCSNEDLQLIRAWYDCLERLPTCTTQTSTEFSNRVLACASHMQLSEGCFKQ